MDFFQEVETKIVPDNPSKEATSENLTEQAKDNHCCLWEYFVDLHGRT
jgi:hypothetical protein